MSLFRQRRRPTLATICRIAAITGVLLLAACGPAPESAEVAASAGSAGAPAAADAGDEAGTRTVVFLGDSLTAGYGLEPDAALPEQVEAVWASQGIDAVAVNAGVSGDTTANGLARFDWSVTAAEPDLLVVSLGANDFLMGVPAEVAKANLAAILERAKAAGIPAVLVGVALRGEAEPGSREAEYSAIYPELAAQFGVPYYPSLLGPVAGDPAMLQADGLHPTEEGVTIIAQPLAEFLEPILADIEAR
jgi:acyl-CoA thioesterase-1